MRFKRFAIAALIAAVSTSVAASTTNAAPADPRPDIEYATASAEQTSGTDSGVDYTMSSTTEGESALHVAVNGGRFALSGDHLDISNDAGQLIGQVPLTFRMDDRVVAFTAQITDSDRAVTIAAAGPAETITSIAQEPLTPEQRMYCWNATMGTLVGLAVGTVLGFPLLMPGILAGGIIGGLVGMSVVLNAPMPGMPPTDDLMTKFFRCQQGTSPFGG